MRDWKENYWDIWRSLPSLTTLFGRLSHTPEAISDDHMKDIERFIAPLYSCTSQILTVNVAGSNYFPIGIESLPLSRAFSISACETCIISSRTYLGTNTDSKPISSKSWRLGLEEGCRWKMDTTEDNSFSSFQALQRTY